MADSIEEQLRKLLNSALTPLDSSAAQFCVVIHGNVYISPEVLLRALSQSSAGRVGETRTQDT